MADDKMRTIYCAKPKGFSGGVIRNWLIDVHHDRHHRHASSKGEGQCHSYEYLCHAHPCTSLSKRQC
jgi:hypothetical protein